MEELNGCKNAYHFLVVFAIALFVGACSSATIKKTGSAVVDVALRTAFDLRGTPYCGAGITPDCFDCSGFVWYCLKAAGVTIPRKASDQFAYGEPIALNQLEEGDLVFFTTTSKSISHVGFFVGNNTFIHSSSSSGVILSSLSDTYWQPRLVGARRVR